MVRVGEEMSRCIFCSHHKAVLLPLKLMECTVVMLQYIDGTIIVIKIMPHNTDANVFINTGKPYR